MGYITEKGGVRLFKRILIPVDGSSTCRHVYKAANDFHEKFDSILILVHVDDTSVIQNYVNYPTPGLSIQIDGQARSAEILRDASKQLDVPDTHLKITSLTGEPASAILNVANQEDADLILICTHGMGATKRFLMGSVTDRVVHHADIPVMIVRQDQGI